MKKLKTLLTASIVNTLFFVWIYITYQFEITWTIAGVFHELFMIPMLFIAPVLMTLSIVSLVKWKWNLYSTLSAIISTGVTIGLIIMIVKDFS